MTSVKSMPNMARACLLMILLGMTTFVSAADSVGKLLFAVRDVQIQHVTGAVEKGVKGAELIEGDTVITGAQGRAQLLMVDGARIALQPNSTFQIEQYQPPTKTEEGDLIASDGNGSGVLSLLKGGMRAVSGDITKSNPDGLSVKTPVATMGIRGTDWTAVLVGSPLRLLVGVRDGQVRISNGLGQINVNAGEYGSAGEDDAPGLSLQQFDELAGSDENGDEGQDVGETEGTGSGQGEGNTGAAKPTEQQSGGSQAGASGGSAESNDGEQQEEEGGESKDGSSDHNAPVSGAGSPPAGPPAAPPTSAPNPTNPPESTTGNNLEDPEDVPLEGSISQIGFVGSRDAQSIEIGQRQNAVGEFEKDGSGSLIRFATVVDGETAVSELSIVGANGSATAETFNLGADTASGFIWGRWASGSATVNPPPQGSDALIELPDQQSIHWFSGAELAGEPLANITASASYSLVGNTEPTDANGNVGVLGSADLTVNFSTQIVDVDLQLGINNQNWSAAGTGALATGGYLPFSGSNLSGTITDGQSAIGTVAGQFEGAFSPNVQQVAGQAVPAGAAFAYGLQGSINQGAINNVVTGIAIVGNPQISGSGGSNTIVVGP